MDLVVNEWNKYSQLAYIRKTCVLSCSYRKSMGFANQERENVNNVDLNRNFDYYWSNGSGTRSTGKTIKVQNL